MGCLNDLKVVSIVFIKQANEVQILVFHHPLAGIQIVKGTVEQNEELEHATLRELYEESGIQNASIQQLIGIYSPRESDQDWYVFLCDVHESLTAQWVHHCADDGGLNFQFFWHPLFSKSTDEWHVIFQDLLAYLQQKFKNLECFCA